MKNKTYCISSSIFLLAGAGTALASYIMDAQARAVENMFAAFHVPVIQEKTGLSMALPWLSFLLFATGFALLFALTVKKRREAKSGSR